MLARTYPTLIKKPITLDAVSATLDFPAQVAGGSKFQVKWTGPANARDFVGIGDAQRKYGPYHYASEGSTLTFDAPDKAGEYKVRYFLAVGDTMLAEKPLTVTGVSASLSAPASVGVGANFKITWTGPNNARDFITVVKAGAPEKQYAAYAYTSAGNPVELRAPEQAGDYELRYSLGQSYATLARTSIQITPGKEEPGLVAVTVSGAGASGNAVEIIFDASGSMLQRIGGKRRIDIARETLTKLTSQVIPAGTQFAMRVFGREKNSCQTDMFIPVGPLNPATAGGQIAKLEAKNGAKTPIGASLAKV